MDSVMEMVVEIHESMVEEDVHEAYYSYEADGMVVEVYVGAVDDNVDDDEDDE